MKIIKYLIYLLALSVVLISVFQVGTSTHPSNGVLDWKEQDWRLKDGKSNPGNNSWNNTGAWIDSKDRLHLTVVKEDDIWKCTELESQTKYLYGTFTWTVESPVFTFDKNSIVGFFTYLDDSQELDIEVTRWGVANGSNLWYSVQPYEIEGNNVGYSVPSSITGTTIYRIEWKPTYIRFTSMQEDGKVIADLNYTNVSGIPKQPEKVTMNLWLSNPPSDGKNIELIISDFTVEEYHQTVSSINLKLPSEKITKQ